MNRLRQIEILRDAFHATTIQVNQAAQFQCHLFWIKQTRPSWVRYPKEKIFLNGDIPSKKDGVKDCVYRWELI